MSEELMSLRREAKFRPTNFYRGPDLPEDGPILIACVDRAIDDVMSLAKPRDPDIVRTRLKALIAEVNLFATEDRDATFKYAIRIWRAAGFAENSNLSNWPDDDVLNFPENWDPRSPRKIA